MSIKVSVVMGSESDRGVMEKCTDVLQEHGINYELNVISAHRNPESVRDYALNLEKRGVKVVIAGAGLSAALPGVVASQTSLPVIGVPIDSGALKGVDALYSIVQMPPGVPVGCMGIGGAKNAALFAIRILKLIQKNE
jgi:5-(carboxyamino)imidazole ribonucleotide mutase